MRICLVAALAQLYTLDPQPANAPQFRFFSEVFPWFSIVLALKKKIILVDPIQANYSSNSICKDAAQHVADHGIFDEMI